MPRRAVQYMPLDQVVEAARNPKVHDVDGIAASITEHGLGELPLLDERTGRLVAGHGRIRDLRDRAARGQAPPDGVDLDPDGGWLVPIIRGWSSRSDPSASSYLVGSNRLTINGGFDDTSLVVLLQELLAESPDLLAAAGFTSGDLDDLIELTTPPDLDDLGRELGDPSESDGWPVVRLKVPKHVAAAWRTQVDAHDGDELAAFAALLEVDATPDPGAGQAWEPDRTVV